MIKSNKKKLFGFPSPHPQLLGCDVSIQSCFISFLLCFTLNADYSSGFGGKYGVQADRVDKSAVGFDYQGKTEKHESQKGE